MGSGFDVWIVTFLIGISSWRILKSTPWSVGVTRMVMCDGDDDGDGDGDGDSDDDGDHNDDNNTDNANVDADNGSHYANDDQNNTATACDDNHNTCADHKCVDADKPHLSL